MPCCFQSGGVQMSASGGTQRGPLATGNASDKGTTAPGLTAGIGAAGTLQLWQLMLAQAAMPSQPSAQQCPYRAVTATADCAANRHSTKASIQAKR